MNNKNKIYIAIISVALLVTVFFVYKSFSGSSSDPSAAVETQTLPSSVNILPLGNKFDIATVKKLNTQFNVYTYPQVSTESIGVTTSNLIKSPTEATANP